MTGHEAFEETLAAYALGTLDEQDRREFEAHLDSCAACRRELAELERVTTGLALGVEPVRPPADLRERTLARATGDGRASRPSATRTSRGFSAGWLAAAASLLLAMGLGGYALALRQQRDLLEERLALASTEIDALRVRLDDLQQGSTRLLRAVSIVSAPDAARIDLAGQADAPTAIGTAFWSATAGLAVTIDGLPALAADQVYQLWVVPSGQSPVSAGFLTVDASGLASFADASAPRPAPAALVAVTAEPAGGSPGPTTPILVVGQI